MTPEKFKEIEEIYNEALNLSGPERKAFLHMRCDDDADLLKEVESLLLIETTNTSLSEPPADIAASLFAEENTADLIGKTIAHYKIISVIGEGGMGEVYLARDLKLKRKVALKTLPPELVNDEERVHRFVHEARSASALNHPNILTIYEIGKVLLEQKPIHYIAMEFVEGAILKKLIYTKKAPLNALIGYLCQVGEGLAKAHAAGIAHRDLKPENIMVNSDGFAKVLDFGLAKLVDMESELGNFQRHRSRSGLILGTIGYMSPEQAKGSAEIDQRSDIFSFGCILYEAVTRKQPFSTESVVDSLHEIIHKDPTPVNKLNPAVPQALVRIVEKCLAKLPDDRYGAIQEVVDLLKELAVLNTNDDLWDADQNDIDTNSLSDAVRTLTISSPAFERRKQVTVVFADISAITELFDAFDPEIANEHLQGLWSEIDSIVSNGGGETDSRFPDSFTAVWGAEVTREGDPESAIRTAISLQVKLGNYFKSNLSGEFDLCDTAALAEDGSGLLRIGIDTGASLVGSREKSAEPRVTGPVLNIAKRLAKDSEVGSTHVTHKTYLHIRGVFDVEAKSVSHKFRLKKGTEEMRIYRILRAKPRAFRLTTRGVGGIETKLIGRKGELDKLLDALYSVLEENELQAITVIGEAGIGKSRLLYEFRDQIELIPEKIRLFNARANEGANNLPFSLLRDLFSFRFEISDTDDERVVKEKFENGMLEMFSNTNLNFTEDEVLLRTRFIGNIIGIDYSESQDFKGIAEDPQQIRERAVFYAKQFLGSLSWQIPIVIYLDDLHWSDLDSLIFFEQLIAEQSAAKILVLGFARPSIFEQRPHWGEGERNHTRIDLTLLSKRETRLMVNNILRHVEHPGSQLTELIVENANGNPFYAEEIVKMLIDQRIISAEAEKWTVNEARLDEFVVPGSLSGVLQARLDQLSTLEKNTLQCAAVIGFEFWANAVKSLEAQGNQEAILNSLREKEIIYRHDSSAFENTREYVFKHAIFRDVTYETILLNDRKRLHFLAARWLAEKCKGRENEYASRIAEHFHHAGRNGDASLWFGKAGEYSQKTHSPELAASYFRRAFKSVGEPNEQVFDTGTEFKWRNGLGLSLHILARFEESIREFESLLERAVAVGDFYYEAKALIGISAANLENANNRTALEAADKVEKITSKDQPDIALDIAKAEGLYRKARAEYSLGNFEKAIEFGNEVMTRAQTFGDDGKRVLVNSYHIQAAAHMQLGHFDDAFRFEEKEVEVSRSVGDLRTLANGLNSLGEQMRLKGDGAKAINYYEQSLRIANETGAENAKIMVLSNMGGAKLMLADFLGAEQDLRAVIETVGDSGHFILPETYRFLGESLNEQGKKREALEMGMKSLQLSVDAENSENTGCAWRAIGKIIGGTEQTVEISGERFSSDVCFKKALEIFNECGIRSESARTLRDFARFASKRKDQLALLEQANAIFRELEMDLEVERTTDLVDKFSEQAETRPLGSV